MKLYEITESMAGLQTLANSEEFSEKMIADTMEGLTASFNEKAKAILQVRQTLIAEAAMIDKECDRLTRLLLFKESSAAKLSHYLKTNMAITGIDNIDLGIFNVTLRKAGVKIGRVDESLVPKKFWLKIPASKKLDRPSMLAAAKLEPVNGVELIDSERALIIK